MIVGDGQSNFTERVLVNGTVLSTNPFVGALGESWDNLTLPLAPAVFPGDAAEAIVKIDTSRPKNDCLTGGAFILSTTVQDTDNDGLLDKWETTSGLTDPNGRALPNLPAMSANPLRKDVFFELGGLWSEGWDPNTTGQVPTPGPHNHLPPPAVLKSIAEALKNSPVANPNGISGVAAHFDVGPLAAYHALGPDYGSTDADSYLVSTGARGGELIREVACVNSPTLTCQFPKFPGTVSWKIGFQVLRDAPVAPNGAELTAAEADACLATGGCRQRFDLVRKDIFHYVLNAHGRGIPKNPCVNADGTPDMACREQSRLPYAAQFVGHRRFARGHCS